MPQATLSESSVSSVSHWHVNVLHPQYRRMSVSVSSLWHELLEPTRKWFYRRILSISVGSTENFFRCWVSTDSAGVSFLWGEFFWPQRDNDYRRILSISVDSIENFRCCWLFTNGYVFLHVSCFLPMASVPSVYFYCWSQNCL